MKYSEVLEFLMNITKSEYNAIVQERDAYKKILLAISDTEKVDSIVLYRIRKLLMKFLLVN